MPRRLIRIVKQRRAFAGSARWRGVARAADAVAVGEEPPGVAGVREAAADGGEPGQRLDKVAV